MGSFEYETQRTNPAVKSNHTATDTAETEEEKHLKSQYKDELTKLQELFTDWTEADLLFALQEAQGDLELTITRISEGHASQWGEVRSRKSKKEQNNKAKTSGQQSGNAQRGHQRGGYSDRGRPRGEGGSRSVRSNDRSRGPKRDNSSGYTRPPRQQNGPNTSNHDDTNNGAHAKSVADNWGNNDSPGGDWNDANESWSSDSKGLNARGNDNIATNDWSADNQHQSSWGDNSAENSKSGWDNDSVTDKGQSSWTNEISTENNHGGRNGDSINNSGGLTTDNKNGADNVNDNFLSREADKSTFIKENNNWDTETSNNNWNVENNWPSDSSKDNRGADSLKNGKTVRDVQRSPNSGVPRSIVTARSPVPNISRTIPSQPKASWAQIVKPESKPDPKPEPVSPPIHKSSPENIKVVSPKITKSPIPVQSSPPPKIPEPISLPSPPEEATSAPVVAAVKIEEIKVLSKEISSPEQPAVTPAVSSPVVNVSPHTKEISPPGIINKTKQAPLRRLKQDAAVVMPSAGAGLERVGVQFGSLNLSNSIQNALPSSVSNVPSATPVNAATPTPTPQNFNPSYFKQEQTSTYLNQQHHLGLATEPLNAAPYGSYLPNQQLSGFSMGPIQSLPEYGALYGPDAAQRMMGYYAAADPAYNQASPVTSAGYQGRGDNNKYTPDTTTSSSNQTTSQQSAGTQQQSTNQQQGQNPQQQAYPLSVQYYPYYYMANQFPSAYQQSGYGQPFVNKSMYPMYNHPHSTKPGSASGASPYGYPTTPTTPNNPHHYSHTSNTGYDEITQIHHLPGVHGVHDYPKAYGGIPPLNFLGNAAGSNPQPTSGSAGSNSTGGKTSNNGNSELNSPAQYKGYTDKASAGSQQAGQAQQMFNNYQYQQTHHQYHPHQAHHQAAGRNQQQYW
ncbi:8605_t:CDS:2, partial [Dentiscutata erythropus]